MEMARVTAFLATVAGGGAAGYIDQKMPRKIAGLSLGTVIGLAAAGVGMTKVAGAHREKVLALGEGMLAGEAYRIVSNRVNPGSVALPADSSQAAQGVRGVRGFGVGGVGAVGALPHPNAVMTDAMLQRAIANVRAA
jgi:hypothetical protein